MREREREKEKERNRMREREREVTNRQTVPYLSRTQKCQALETLPVSIRFSFLPVSQDICLIVN